MVNDLGTSEFVVPMRIKKNSLYLAGVILVVLVGAVFLFSNSGRAAISNGATNQETQIVKLSVVGGNYVLEPSEFKKGVPVKIEADISKMPGCSKSIVIPSFGISKTVSSGDNIIAFTPNEAGTFNIACSMNMYRGSFTVLESDGTKSNYIEQKSNSGGSCGGSGGGCGCGG